MAERRNPFLDDIFLGDPRSVGEGEGRGVGMHAGALGRLVGAVPRVGEAPSEASSRVPGRVVLVLAPRAGFGKSHLIARAASELRGRAMVVPIELSPESGVRWARLQAQVVEAVHEPASGGRTLLDEAARWVFSRLNRALIAGGDIPCGNRAEAERALRRDYLSLFDFSDPRQVVASWFGENFEKLMPVMEPALAREAGVAPGRAAFWLRVFCAYAQSYGEPEARRRDTLRWAMGGDVADAVSVGGMAIAQAGGDPELDCKEKLRDFCRIVSLHRPVVFVLDNLDAFFRDREAGAKIGYVVAELQRMIPREVTVLSLNDDVWRSAFVGVLPSAFEDRLTGEVVNLRGVNQREADSLVRGRLEDAGVEPDFADSFCHFLRIEEYFVRESGKLVSPRAVLRHAAVHWDVFTSDDGEDGPDEAVGQGMEDESGAAGPPALRAFPDFIQHPDHGGPPEGGPGQSVIGYGTAGDIGLAAAGLAQDDDWDDGPVEAAETPGGSGPEPAAEGERGENPFKRLKDMLRKLQTERADAPSDAEVTGGSRPAGIFDGGIVRAPAPGPAGEVVNGQAGGESDVYVRYAEARQRWEAKVEEEPLQQDRLARLVQVSGKRFPVVRYDEFELPEFRGSTVGKWAFRDNEIYFGFEPPEKGAFWGALVAFVRARGSAPGLASPVAPRTKVVQFLLVNDDAPAAPGSESSLDTVRLDRTATAALYAADELVGLAEAGEMDADPGQILGTLARQLDFFWKRVTRPLPDRARAGK